LKLLALGNPTGTESSRFLKNKVAHNRKFLWLITAVLPLTNHRIKKKKKKIIIQKPHRLFIEDVNPQVKTNYYKTPN